jgi:hypothetical protein
MRGWWPCAGSTHRLPSMPGQAPPHGAAAATRSSVQGLKAWRQK